MRNHIQANSKNRKRTIKVMPGLQKRFVKLWQEPRIIGIRVREDLQRRCIKFTLKPIRHEHDPTRRRLGETLHPLTEKRNHFKFDVNNRETTKKRTLNNSGARVQLMFTTPEKGKGQGSKLFKNPCRHMNKRRYIPNTGKGQSINNEGLATKGENTRTRGFKNTIHRINSRTPVVLLPVAQAKKNTKDLNFGGRPV